MLKGKTFFARGAKLSVVSNVLRSKAFGVPERFELCFSQYSNATYFSDNFKDFMKRKPTKDPIGMRMDSSIMRARECATEALTFKYGSSDNRYN